MAPAAVLRSRAAAARVSAEGAPPSEDVAQLKVEMCELEDKAREAMIAAEQLDNEKAALGYEVDSLKDALTDTNERHSQLQKEHRRKCLENEQLRRISNKLRHELAAVRKVLQERDQLIQEYGLVIVGDTENGDCSEGSQEPPGGAKLAEENCDSDDDGSVLNRRAVAPLPRALVSQQAAEIIEQGAAQGSLDVRLRSLWTSHCALQVESESLRAELRCERDHRSQQNGVDSIKQKEADKYVNEYKFRVQKAEAEVATLQANVVRLESLVSRYRTSTEELERSEEDLKAEKRRLQRELRDATTRLEDAETTASQLQRRFDKLKLARSTFLKDLSQDSAANP